MNNDRELLELAAKAVGYTGRVEYSGTTGECVFLFDLDTARRTGRTAWAPHEDCGDALRLAVALRLNIYRSAVGKFVSANNPQTDCTEYLADHSTEEAATCRAIFRAAAEVGKAMP